MIVQFELYNCLIKKTPFTLKKKKSVLALAAVEQHALS